MSGVAEQSSGDAGDCAMTPARGWGARIRWFLSEFVVIVAGVLVALAVNAWWQGRQDRQMEVSYLQQLQADLDVSNRTLTQAHAVVQDQAKAAAAVLHEFWRRGQGTDADIRRQMSIPLRSGRVLPVLGTARSLIASGDLRLIQSAVLRSAIPSYVDAMDADVADIARYDETYYRLGAHETEEIFDSGALLSSAELSGLHDYSIMARPDATTPPPFPVDVDALLKNPKVYHAYSNLLFGHRGQASRYADMQQATAALQKQIAAALADMHS
jgi:hypothetical protein